VAQCECASVSVTEALKRFQEFDGLIVTSKLDKDTIELMTRPRSGVLLRKIKGKLISQLASIHTTMVMRILLSPTVRIFLLIQSLG
jgi:hypothetical protein